MFILGYAKIVLKKVDVNISKISLLSKGGKLLMNGFISFNEEPIYTNYIDFNKIQAKIWVKEEIKNIKFLKITSLQGFSSSDFVFTCSLLG